MSLSSKSMRTFPFLFRSHASCSAACQTTFDAFVWVFSKRSRFMLLKRAYFQFKSSCTCQWRPDKSSACQFLLCRVFSYTWWDRNYGWKHLTIRAWFIWWAFELHIILNLCVKGPELFRYVPGHVKNVGSGSLVGQRHLRVVMAVREVGMDVQWSNQCARQRKMIQTEVSVQLLQFINHKSLSS